jgi:D-xylose 1-dehydrogenase
MVTGGASGIGAAIVRAFVDQGASVGFIDINAAAGEALAAELGAPVWFRRIDVSETVSLKHAIADFAAGANGLSVLINNVGNDTRHDPAATTEAVWRGALAQNLDAAFFASQAAIALMCGPSSQRAGGAIVNLSSINAIIGPPQMPGYVAAKSALLGLTKALAREYGPADVRVNCILPGWVVTERQLRLWLTPEAEEAWMKDVPLKRRILPEDVARLALFLASDDSAMITGQHFAIDGGRT